MLKTLSPNQVYSWESFLSKNEAWHEDGFILQDASHEVVPKVKLRKVFIGADAWRDNNLRLGMGNHCFRRAIAG